MITIGLQENRDLPFSSVRATVLIVGGVTPGRHYEGFGFNSIHEAVEKTDANAAMIFVPPPFAADSILSVLDKDFLGLCITEGIPILDMVKVKSALKGSKTK